MNGVDRLESTGGPVTCREEEDGDGLEIHVDPDSDLGERLSWSAGHRGMSADELLTEAIQDKLDTDRDLRPAERLDESVDGQQITQCSACGERFDVSGARGAFDGDVARYICPNCGQDVEGPMPGSAGQ